MVVRVSLCPFCEFFVVILRLFVVILRLLVVILRLFVVYLRLFVVILNTSVDTLHLFCIRQQSLQTDAVARRPAPCSSPRASAANSETHPWLYDEKHVCVCVCVWESESDKGHSNRGKQKPLHEG